MTFFLHIYKLSTIILQCRTAFMLFPNLTEVQVTIIRPLLTHEAKAINDCDYYDYMSFPFTLFAAPLGFILVSLAVPLLTPLPPTIEQIFIKAKNTFDFVSFHLQQT